MIDAADAPGRGKERSPAVSAAQRAYGGPMANVLHHTYLPFTADQLREHFAPVAGPGERDLHLRYYLASVEEARKYDELIRSGDKPTPAAPTAWLSELGGRAGRRPGSVLRSQSPLACPLPRLAPRSSGRTRPDPLPQKAGGSAGGAARRNDED